jgi:hypothetical protein
VTASTFTVGNDGIPSFDGGAIVRVDSSNDGGLLKSAFVKVFGRRPLEQLRRRRGAGIRKPSH